MVEDRVRAPFVGVLEEAVTAGERAARQADAAPDGPCSPRDPGGTRRRPSPRPVGGASGGGAELPGQGLLVDLADGGERQAGQEMDPVRDQMVLADNARRGFVGVGTVCWPGMLWFN